jgi:hypothetical protein
VTRDQAAAFIADLDELTRKHGIAVSACGCCDSPWLVEVGKDGAYVCQWDEWPSLVASGLDWRPDKADGGD